MPDRPDTAAGAPDPGPEPEAVPDVLPAELAAVGLLLGRVDLGWAAAGDPEPPPWLEDAVVARVAAARAGEADGWVEDAPRARRGGVGSARARAAARWWAAGGVAAAAAAVVVALLVVGGSDSDEAQLAFTLAPSGVDATYSLHERQYGTEIELDVSGLEPGRYWLWLTDESGVRTSAGTFSGGPSEGTLRFTTALPTEEARRIWVTDALDDGDVVLDANVPA